MSENMIFDIALFENDLPQANKIEAIIRESFSTPTRINTSNEITMKSFINTNNRSTLYLLDIVDENNSNKMVGFTLAQKIISKNNNDLIVFVTSYVDLLLTNSLLKTKIFSFIPKFENTFKSDLVQTIELAGERFSNTCYRISTRFEDIYVPYKDICFVETIPNVKSAIQINCLNGTHFVRSNLKMFEKNSDDKFIRVSKYYLVNPKNIFRIDKTERLIFFKDGSQCSYSRNFKITELTLDIDGSLP